MYTNDKGGIKHWIEFTGRAHIEHGYNHTKQKSQNNKTLHNSSRLDN